MLAAAGAVSGVTMLARRQSSAPAPAGAPPVTTSARESEAKYVGRSSCAECHPEQVSLFTGSHHDLAMQKADERTVLGDFADTVNPVPTRSTA